MTAKKKITVDELICELGKKVKEYREQNSLFQVQMAKKAGVSTPVISDIENCNIGNISLQKLLDICHCIGYSFELELRPLK